MYPADDEFKRKISFTTFINDGFSQYSNKNILNEYGYKSQLNSTAR